MELYLTGRGSEVPGTLAGEGYTYVSATEEGAHWELEASTATRGPTGTQAPEQPAADQRRVTGAALATQPNASPTRPASQRQRPKHQQNTGTPRCSFERRKPHEPQRKI
jgi:hypothetical protein